MERYSRQIKLSEFNQRGQNKLLASSVLIIGLGGLGCPVAQYLAGAGIGKLGLLDGDTISLTNLHRQVLYSEDECGEPKVMTAAKHMKRLNAGIKIESYNIFLTPENGPEILSQYDVIVDCTDNIPARLLINDLCSSLNKPWVYGGVRQFEGQVTVFNHKNGPTYRCLFPDHTLDQASCEEEGVLGTTPGIIGLYMTNEVIKLVAGIDEVLSGVLKMINLLTNESKLYRFHRNEVNFDQNSSLTLKSITPVHLNELIQNDPDIFLLDVREKDEFEFCHIPDSINIPLSELHNSLEKIPKTHKTIVGICHHGIRSKNAMLYLQTKGYADLNNLEGGIDQWSIQIDSSIPRY